MDWQFASDIQKETKNLVKKLSFDHVDQGRIFCFRSYGSKSRAIARIWSLPKIWQKALSQTPAYCLEIIAEKFDKLKSDEKKKILIHELLHIPKNFSGALLSHQKRKGKSFRRRVEELFKEKIR